jgi:hypothetical protein
MVMLPGDQFAVVPSASAGLDILDITKGAIINTLVPPDNLGPSSVISSVIVSSVAVDPLTGNFATGQNDGSVIQWNALRGPASVKQTTASSQQPLEVFAANGCITVRVPVLPAIGGKLFVYRSDGRRYFTSEVPAGESSVTTSVLPSGDYFIAFEPASGGQFFAKASLFQ